MESDRIVPNEDAAQDIEQHPEALLPPTLYRKVKKEQRNPKPLASTKPLLVPQVNEAPNRYSQG